MRLTSICARLSAGGLIAAILCLGDATPLCASELADAVHACAAEPDDAKRLACYDSAAGRSHSQIAPRAGGVAATKPPVIPTTTGAPTPGTPDITATITKLSRHADGRYVITLSNGQVWLEAETKERFQADTGDLVNIRTELLGTHYLRTPKGFDVRVIPEH